MCCRVNNHSTVDYGCSLEDFKPLLYSLDDFSKWEKCKSLTDSNKVHNEIYDLAYRYITPNQCSYAAIQAMAEAHIDFFNLIPAGLAVRKEPLK